ncbi:hypothetical protein NQ317_013993 [Molorchus minor]|uniref:EGF-like domain-containing protein n=1 Tax=Molorchus minor TaxID=1323400 RepID=A0ABQ9JGJ0_9CUCU|nr:hypothetical protein NQ317_013993 [Molorchus minor]
MESGTPGRVTAVVTLTIPASIIVSPIARRRIKASGIDCSGNGICIEGTCTCNGGWGGIACHLENCPNNCGAVEERGVCEPERGCSCFGNYRGHDCSQIATGGYWETVTVQGFVPPGCASHGAAVWRDSMYIIAGESYNQGSLLFVYDFNGMFKKNFFFLTKFYKFIVIFTQLKQYREQEEVGHVWETPHIEEGPPMRYGHSTVIYGDKIFLYGGVLGNRGPTSELWAFDISAKTWENITVKAASCNNGYLMCGPIKLAGHSSTIVINNISQKADRMVIIFGHSPDLGYLNTVQEYYFGTREWYIINTKGYPVKGGYGHSASWDPLTGKIYVYGGIISEGESVQFISKNLYSYEPNERIWMLLADAPSARFLHTATFISEGLLFVFGGNTHNDSSHSTEAKCYSSEMLTYDVLCDTWNTITTPKDINVDLARYGHSAVVFEGSLYIYGGFDGQMLTDIIKYTPGNCDSINETSINDEASGLNPIYKADYCPMDPIPICKQLHTCKACTSQPFCRWRLEHSKCVADILKSNISVDAIEPMQCQNVCAEYNSCSNCTQQECIWCQNEGRCVDKNAYTPSFPYGQCREWTTVGAQCRSKETKSNSPCNYYKTCAKCRDDPACGWCDDGSKTGIGVCIPGGYAGNKRDVQFTRRCLLVATYRIHHIANSAPPTIVNFVAVSESIHEMEDLQGSRHLAQSSIDPSSSHFHLDNFEMFPETSSVCHFPSAERSSCLKDGLLLTPKPPPVAENFHPPPQRKPIRSVWSSKKLSPSHHLI